jgi:methylmalonyl-CoA mutase N-terminal domain/subunit
MAGKRTTTSGIEIKEVYTEPSKMNERPGEFPYTRGIQKDMYRGKPWTMRQYAGFSTAEESNKRYHYLLSQGTMGLSVAFDLPTQIGYDSDHELAEGEVGKVGVAIDSLKDIEILFDGIQLKDITTSMTINATAPILLAMYIALAKKQGANLNELSGTVQNDILKEYAARGTYIYPPAPSMRLITDVFEYCSKEVPKWNTISISGYHIREAGSTAVQELAFTFAKRLSFFFNCHNNFFEEIAKFRAARRMWAHITKELGATDAGAQKLRFHTQTGGSTLTAQQPMNNIVRVTTQALAAVLGGTQSLHTNGYDEAIALPTEAAAKIALRTQQIIAFESGATDTVDPLAGSYFIEALTDELEAAAQLYIDKIDAMGGSVKAIEQDYIQQEIASSAYQYQNEIESGEKVIVGVNKFVQAEVPLTNVFRVDDSIRTHQIEKINKLRAQRDNIAVANNLKKLKEAANGSENLMPYILTAVESYATLGEIADTLRAVFGEY